MSRSILLAPILFLFILVGLPAGGAGESDGKSSDADSTETVTITDSLGRTVVVTQPVEAIISMNSGLSEVVAALGAADRTIGRCSYSTFPTEMRRVLVVGKNSSSPNMETIVAMEPDLVIADSMFDEGKIETLEKIGVSVVIEATSNPERFPILVRNLGVILGEEERAEELLTIVDETVGVVAGAVAELNLPEEERTVVFFENRKPHKSASALSGHHYFITTAGGRNIAANEPVKYPALSPEFITMENPEVIVRRVSGDIDEDAMEAMRLTIIDRPSLQSVRAVQEDRVYIIKSDLFISLRYPVGIAYFAELFYPGRLEMDPEDIHRGFIEAVYGADEWEQVREIYVYPER